MITIFKLKAICKTYKVTHKKFIDTRYLLYADSNTMAVTETKFFKTHLNALKYVKNLKEAYNLVAPEYKKSITIERVKTED